MKALICAGGNGTRLRPMTFVTNKHLLPVYDRPMIYYPIETIKKAGITDIMIVTGKEHAGAFMTLLGSGHEMGVNITYRLQDQAGGIAEAVALAEDFAAGESLMVILGDNIFSEALDVSRFSDVVKNKVGAQIFLQYVTFKEARRFGVAVFEGGLFTKIVEKPATDISRYAVTGCYLYDNTVFDRIRTCKPSSRGELEITDVNNSYLAEGNLFHESIHGFWSDAGTVETLYAASERMKQDATKWL